MVCSTAILSASLALSLLRHGFPPEMPTVISPYSLTTALSIVHDGANGTTQKELTNLLLNGSWSRQSASEWKWILKVHSGCTPAEVTEYYSSLARSLPSANENGAAFKSANRLYVDDSVSFLEYSISHRTCCSVLPQEWLPDACGSQIRSEGGKSHVSALTHECLLFLNRTQQKNSGRRAISNAFRSRALIWRTRPRPLVRWINSWRQPPMEWSRMWWMWMALMTRFAKIPCTFGFNIFTQLIYSKYFGIH